MHTTFEQFSQTDILKAQFCRQYFIELKQFLSDFDISDKKDGTYANNLDMHDLMRDSLNAYSYKPKNNEKEKGLTKKEIKEKTCEYRDARRFNMYWQLGPIKESDLMLAIEQFFYITENKKYGENGIDLQERRNKLLTYLLDSTNDSVIDFEDYTLHSILDCFNVLKDTYVLDEKHVNTIGDQVQEFIRFAETAPEDLKRFKYALSLFRELRNWKSHQGTLPYMIVQLNLFHKFIVFTYIGLVYVCRRIWGSNNKLVRHLDKGKQQVYNRPEEALDFNMPREKVHLIIKKDESKNISCFYCPQDKEEGEELKPTNQTGEEFHFDIFPQKYVPFKLKIIKDSIDEPFIIPKELNYYSWFLTLEINIPRVIVNYKGIAGNNTQIEKLISELASGIEGCIDKKIKENIETGLVKLQPFLYQIQQTTEKSVEFNGLQGTIIASLGILKEMLEAQNDKIAEIQQDLKKIMSDFETKEQKKRAKEQLVFNRVHLLWLFPISFVIYLYFYLDKWCRNLIWLDYKLNYYWIILIFLVVPLVIYRFGYLKVHGLLKRPWIKWADISIGMLLFLLIAVFPLTIPYRSANSYIKSYNFSIHNRAYNEKAVIFAEKYLSKNKKSEDAMIMLATYYLNYTKNIKEALRVTEPMRNVWDYKEGAFYAAEALYKQGDYAAVRNIFDDYKEAYKNFATPDLLYLQGVMLSTDNKGYMQDIDRCRQYLLLAISYGEIENKYGDYRRATRVAEAAYELGYLLSHDTSGFLSDSLFVSTGIIEFSSNNNNHNIDGDTLFIPAFNLPIAAKYLRKAAPLKPEAALELGNIYSDLNMNDSALLYYDKVIAVTNEDLQLEAIFRKSLVYEKNNISYPNHEEKAKILTYAPARLHRALKMLNKKDAHKDLHRIINELDSVTHYNGRRYIPLKVFAYIQSGEKEKALQILQDFRSGGKFDMNFVEGMTFMLQKEGSIGDSLGMEYMRKSANQGCLYAQMICLYRDIESGKGKVSEFDYLIKEIGDSIPFAYALASRLALLINTPVWACKYAAIASGKGHPAGALVLTSLAKGGINVGAYYKKLFCMNTLPDEEQVGLTHAIRQFLHYCARLSPKKLFAIEMAYLSDNYFYRFEKQKPIPLDEIRFWSDAAIANKLTGLELQLMLVAEKQNDDLYYKKLLESLIHHIDKKCDDPSLFGKLSIMVISHLDEEYIDSLRNIYNNDDFKKELLSPKYLEDTLRNWAQTDPQKLNNAQIQFSIDPQIPITSLIIDDRAILNELSDYIIDDLYDRPLKYE